MTDSDHLEAALDRLHRCILIADFTELPKIVMETERLTAQLGVAVDKRMADRLRYKANRNALCLQAAARGLRAAQRRLAEVICANSQLSTYTNQGQRSEVGTGPGVMAKRL